MSSTVMDLFAGPGGLSLGLSQAGWDVVLGVEIDPDAAKTFHSLHPDADLYDSDIAETDFRPFRGNVTLVAAGVPCQPFSSGGKRLAQEDPRDGFPQLLRAVGEVAPAAVLVENVAGLTRGSRLAYLEDIVVRFEELGFTVRWQVLNAADYGVPQKRQRLFLVGLRGREFEFPAPTHGPGRAKPWVASESVLSKDRILGEPNPAMVTFARNPDLRPSPYDGHLFNGGGRPIDLSSPSHTILASAGGNKTHFIDTLGAVPRYHAYLRRGGRAGQGKLPGARRITIEESARLQTFPPNTQFAGSRSAQYEQVGNAVPPLLAERIGRALLDQVG